MRGFNIEKNIIQYTVGNPLKTDAVVLKGTEIDIEKIKYLEKTGNCFKYTLKETDVVYGLGENMKGMNKRGWIYNSFCSDDPCHTPDKRSLYGAHNFILVNGENKFGIFVDFPGKMTFDIGYTNINELVINIPEENYNLYIIEGDSLKDIVGNFRRLIGKSYIPPKWAFGFQQSRWSYANKKEVLEVVDNFDKNNIPVDCVYLDIDYMQDFKNFTINKEAFSDFEELVKETKEKGIRLIPIIDAGCKIEEGYDVYEEGIKNGYYCKDENGKPFVAAVWPGKVHFPDFLNKDARLWFGEKYKFLTEKGIEGFWNDMNEPAIFYSEERLNEAFEKVSEMQGKNLDIYSFFGLKDTFLGLSNSIEDYKSFYHNIDGQVVRHDKVHNLYGYNMTRSAFDGLEKIDPNKRYLLFSRASYVGAHRYGGIWTGDNSSWWEHLKLNISMMPNINMCGFLYTGADTGGFGGDATSELVTRWTQFSIFAPLFRNHAAMGTRKQEPYSFGEETSINLKNIMDLRYALVPYLYSEFMKAVDNHGLYFKPLSFEYNDDFVNRVEDQLLLGDEIMLAPIYEQNSKGRYVYLPEEMLLWTTSGVDDKNFKVVNKGHTYIDLELKELPIFIRKNRMLVICNPENRVEKLSTKELNVVAFIEDKAVYTLFDDDGISKEYKESCNELNIIIEKLNDDYNIVVNKIGDCKVEKLNLSIWDIKGNLTNKVVNIKSNI